MEPLRLTRQGVEIPKSHPQLCALVRKDLCVAPVSLNDPYPKKFKVYLESPTKYVVPLHWARGALKNFGVTFKDTRTPATPAPALAEFKGSLRPELSQPQAVKAVVDSWNTCGGAMLCLPVGFGKVKKKSTSDNAPNYSESYHFSRPRRVCVIGGFGCHVFNVIE